MTSGAGFGSVRRVLPVAVPTDCRQDRMIPTLLTAPALPTLLTAPSLPTLLTAPAFPMLRKEAAVPFFR